MHWSKLVRMAVVIVSLGSAWVVASTPPTAGANPHAELINDALEAVLEHQGRWAYTETQIGVGKDGKPTEPSVHRIDPSKPYAEQYTPILVKGKPATDKDRKKAAKRGEQIAKRRLEGRTAEDGGQQTEDGGQQAEDGGRKAGGRRVDEVNLSVQGRKVKPQIDQARVVAEDEATVTLLVPLLPAGERDRILDKFELTSRINKASRQFESVMITQQAPLRVKLVAKVSDLRLQIDFSTPDPKYPAFATKMSASGSFALFWGRDRDFAVESVRTDLQRVTPYDERFQVRVGEARTIEF